MNKTHSVGIFLCLFSFYQCVFASAGDASRYYRDCVTDCEKGDCAKGFSLWSCTENCEYDCQWDTVRLFLVRNWPIPQFGGKWPFIRFMGLQEPASALFSVFNFLVVLQCLRKYRKAVRVDAPYRTLWHIYSMVCLNCWLWSTVYHTRDTESTERLDYLSASCMVFTSFFTMTVRVFELGVSLRSIIWGILCSSVLINHCAYLWLFRFDYSYNMLFNVVIGAITVAGWLTWAAVSIKKGRGYCKYIAYYAALMAVSALLELFDFPPLYWALDAHAMWHFSTSFIIPIFYIFITHDSLYLQNVIDPTKIH